MVTIHGECMGVEIIPRKDGGPLVHLLVEDDGNWGRSSDDGGGMDVYWLGDLIVVLQLAKHYVEDNFDRSPEGYFQGTQ